MNGHTVERCLKKWVEQYDRKDKQEIRCMQCLNVGHLKCQSEAESAKIPVNPKVVQNLNEFHKIINDSQNQGLEEACDQDIRVAFDYIDEIMPVECADEDTNTTLKWEDDLNGDYLLPQKHHHMQVYCSHCGE